MNHGHSTRGVLQQRKQALPLSESCNDGLLNEQMAAGRTYLRHNVGVRAGGSAYIDHIG
jgi:hypothetical protein